MNHYVLAVLASVCFGIVVFPWQSTLRTLGFAGFIGVTGAVYVLTGAAVYWSQGIPHRPTLLSFGMALLTAGIYATALVLCSYVFTRPAVNIVVAATIVAAYPAWTVLISLFVLRKPLSLAESAFLIMVLVGIIGLSLSSRPVQ